MPEVALSNADIVEVAKSLPTAPRIFARIQETLERSSSRVDEIVDLVRMDAGLSAGVVRIANSVLYRRGDRVDSVDDAINRVGLREVTRLVGFTVANQLFSAGLPLYGVSAERLWEHSLMTALAMSKLARRTGQDESFAYTVGLLRVVGMTVLQLVGNRVRTNPLSEDQYNLVRMKAWELQNFGITSIAVTGILLREWGFPSEVTAAVRHHVHPEGDPLRSRLPALLHAGVAITESLKRELPCEAGWWSMQSETVAQAGLRTNEAEELIPDLLHEFNQVRNALQSR